MDLIGPIIEVIKFIGRPARKYLKYHRKFSEYMDDFKQAQADLNNRKGDIHRQLQDEHRFGKQPKQEVEGWLREAGEKLGHAQHVEDKVRKGNYLFRSCLGKLVDETTQTIKEVYGKGHFSNGLVVNDSTTAVELPTPEIIGETNVREEILKYLMGDEVGMIGVCGMGGIGKTTIMKDVHNRLLEEDKSKKLIWATVSQDFDVRRLQNDIASQLKETLSDDKNTTIRAGELLEMLRKQGSYVLILDDVWSSFFLEDVGILKPTADNGCKLVLTTRSEEVVRSMDCKKVQVPCLSMEEAMKLFLSKAGQDTLPNPTLKPIMELVVRECDGLPLAITTVAGCMKGKSDPLAWHNALNELKGHIIRSLRDLKDKVFGCLKFSYHRLEPKDQDCFLYCALYPEDFEIEKEEIVEYWMEEGLIHEMGTRQAMQGNGHSILQKLEENCLLERAREGTHIKMHDVVRDMALDITRERFLVQAGKQLEDLPNQEEWGEDVEKVSLMWNSISKIPQNMLSPKCQKLTTLLLSNNSLTKIPESFFENMPNLKILDLSRNYVKKLPDSISNLKKLTALLLWKCRALQYVPSLSKLQALKKLDLALTNIKKIPQGLEMLINLRYLDLYCPGLEVIPDGILSKLCDLQHLIIYPATSRAEEMKTLNKLEFLKVCFNDMHDLSVYAGQRKRPNCYYIFVGRFRTGFDISIKKITKSVTITGSNLKIENSIILPSDIQGLCLKKCDGASFNDIVVSEGVTDLKKCTIDWCNGLESIFSSRCASLQTIEILILVDLRNLKIIVGESIPPEPGTFSNLRRIYIISCAKLKNLFSAKWVLQNLHNLEEISVGYCDEMEEIIASEKEGMSTDNNVMFTLPKLKILTLRDLPKLKSTCRTNEVRICDSLQQIEIQNCPKLKRIPLPSPPPCLKEICIRPKEWWESVEWDHPNANNVLLPFVKFWDNSIHDWKQAI